MNDPTSRAAEQRDQALRDLRELECQVAAGEMAPADAARLRGRYEREAAEALDKLDTVSDPPPAPDAEDRSADAGAVGPRTPGAATGARRRAPRLVVYGLGAAAVLAAVLSLPGYLATRPDGGLVSGNEAVQGAAAPPATRSPDSNPRDLSQVTDAEMEAVVAANPEIVGMRLALAERYSDQGRYDLAAVHYTKVLEKDPSNAEAKGHLGWIMLQLDRPAEAARLVDESRATDARLLDVLWFQANIRLYGLGDAKAALASLDEMRARSDLTPQVRRQVEELRRVATQRMARTR